MVPSLQQRQFDEPGVLRSRLAGGTAGSGNMEHHEQVIKQLIREESIHDDPFADRFPAQAGFPGNLIDHNLLTQQQDDTQDAPGQGY